MLRKYDPTKQLKIVQNIRFCHVSHLKKHCALFFQSSLCPPFAFGAMTQVVTCSASIKACEEACRSGGP